MSILLRRSTFKRGSPYWVLEENPAERSYITLVCLMNDLSRIELTDFHVEVKKLIAQGRVLQQHNPFEAVGAAILPSMRTPRV